MVFTVEEVENIYNASYDYAKSQDFKGYNKHDGLNSPFLRSTLGWSKWSRIFCIQAVMRFPINIRPFLLIPKTYNPKGISLFIRSLLFRYEKTNESYLLKEAEDLLLLLDRIAVCNQECQSWGYQYPWQDLGFYAKKNTPNAVVTAFVCNAFLHAYKVTHNYVYLKTVRKSIRFFFNELQVLKNTRKELCLSYMPLPMTMRVMDVSILIGSVVAEYEKLSNISFYTEEADRLVKYVVSQQTEKGSWFYTDPKEMSPIRHDNYHTGFILDALWSYMNAREDYSFKDEYYAGLSFYADNLFNIDGAPKWMSDKELPYDIHGSAQGVISFSRHYDRYFNLTNKILNWTLSNLYSGRGVFYYQKNRFYTKKINLLRWCNAWMCFALSCYLYYYPRVEEKSC
ncbi:hypothetical protein [Zooshikella ganghwensis]|uniref:hypothetical protein n=1 Tax=Zooshikella ganghwensis TaxID=202772 RepID=UPI0004074228|nr:hypothetical protein [Zooshikella ganghwensis]